MPNRVPPPLVHPYTFLQRHMAVNTTYLSRCRPMYVVYTQRQNWIEKVSSLSVGASIAAVLVIIGVSRSEGGRGDNLEHLRLHGRESALVHEPLSSEYGIYKTVKTQYGTDKRVRYGDISQSS
jgi:hypothetical protein